ncbi:MAG: hypothetical protein KDA72_09675, partial [Planctomycetales bacterium]|nr:hypothetical protein [Planctomycetales bacterium]
MTSVPHHAAAMDSQMCTTLMLPVGFQGNRLLAGLGWRMNAFQPIKREEQSNSLVDWYDRNPVDGNVVIGRPVFSV